MNHKATSIRTFIGAKNFEESRRFYKDFGFQETYSSGTLAYFKVHDQLGFYLQDYYVKAWINNSMIFLEVDDVSTYWQELIATELDQKYNNVRFTPIKEYDWGKECFMHDPSGILWHFGEFYDKA